MSASEPSGYIFSNRFEAMAQGKDYSVQGDDGGNRPGELLAAQRDQRAYHSACEPGQWQWPGVHLCGARPEPLGVARMSDAPLAKGFDEQETLDPLARQPGQGRWVPARLLAPRNVGT
ncbi:hypothetical protein VA602_19910 [Pseudomonas sp. MH2]|uniref:Uncharacterized protein n=1 Tax=Pseudomonas machongensis TaxID=3110229 RepID=A0ABU5VJN3_9PSED|nr:hypothetical protein [Pseudomonas sp. MH2]MEA5673586.1 hypothetical protein [Pseudomonas sp. MH2]